MRTLFARLAALFRGRRLDRELDEEVSLHLSMLEQEFVAAGMTPADAKLAARREFGGVAQTKEAYRDGRGIPWLEDTARDFRHAIRRLRNRPGFTATAMISLVLGIGTTTAVFSLFYPLMVRKLPVPNPDELVIFEVTGGMNRIVRTPFYSAPYPLYREVASRKDLFSGVAAATGTGLISGLEAHGEWVSGNYFNVLGVTPALGRLFEEADNREGNQVVVISYDFWQRKFGGDPAALGRRVGPYEMIGVTRQGFRGVFADRRADLWLPAAAHGQLTEEGVSWIWMIGRPKPGVPDRHIQAALDVHVSHYFARFSAPFDPVSRRLIMEKRLKLRDGSLGFSAVRDQFGKPLSLLMAAVVVLLVTACVNIAGLIFARAHAERRERALRIALGAGRARIVRQSLMESVVLAACSGVLGLAIAASGRLLVLHFLPATLGSPFDGPYLTALAFSFGLLVISTALFGLLPALRTSVVDPAAGLREAAGPASATRASIRKSLVVAQVAFSSALVGLAALFGASLVELRSSSARFPNQNVLTFSPRFPAGPSAKAEFMERIQALPGVTSVSTGTAPFSVGFSTSSIRVHGSEKTMAQPAQVLLQRAADRYFETLGLAVVAGREFNASDAANGAERAIVNEAFVREFMPGDSHPTLRTFSFETNAGAGKKPVPIVGVVRDLPHHGLREDVPPTIYLALRHGAGPETLVASSMPTSTLVPAIRREVERLKGNLLREPQIVGKQIDESIFQDRLLAALSLAFGSVALLLAAVGIYGVVAFETARRSGEIGIRIALGAGRAGVVWLVMRGILVLIAAGLVVGIPGAALAARAARSIVFGVNPGDPRLFILVALVLIAAGLAAAFIPARRAARMDPIQALRHE